MDYIPKVLTSITQGINYKGAMPKANYYTCNALSVAALTHPQRCNDFNFVQKLVKYAGSVSPKAIHPLLFNFLRYGQP